MKRLDNKVTMKKDKPVKLIIAGTRTLTSYDLVMTHCLNFIRTPNFLFEIISGGAMGADALGERFANYHGITIKTFRADWSKYGPAAGPIRNKAMAKYATHCIVFWDGKSKGTKSMIDEAVKAKLVLTIVQY